MCAIIHTIAIKLPIIVARLLGRVRNKGLQFSPFSRWLSLVDPVFVFMVHIIPSADESIMLLSSSCSSSLLLSAAPVRTGRRRAPHKR